MIGRKCWAALELVALQGTQGGILYHFNMMTLIKIPYRAKAMHPFS